MLKTEQASQTGFVLYDHHLDISKIHDWLAMPWEILHELPEQIFRDSAGEMIAD